MKISDKGVKQMSEKKSILLRLTPGIWEEINRWAEEEFRSVNGQIEYLLSEAVRKRKKSSSGQADGVDQTQKDILDE